MSDCNEREGPLWTLADQKRLAGKNKIPQINPEVSSIKPKFVRQEVRIQKLEAELDLVHDREKIAHMEQVLIERGLMPIVEKRSTLQFVKLATFEKERNQKELYYQYWQKALRENEDLQRRLDNALGVKQIHSDERW